MRKIALLLCLAAAAVALARIGALVVVESHRARPNPPASRPADSPPTPDWTPDRRREEEILASLGLTPRQLARFRRHTRELDARIAALERMPSGFAERAMRINSWWRSGLRRIFTPEQYRLYRDLWNRSSPVEPRTSPSADGPPPTGESPPAPKALPPPD